MKNPEPLYLLVGPEEGEKREFITDTIKAYSSSAGEQPEVHRFYAGQTDAYEVISLLKNGSLFSSYKFIIFNGIEGLKKHEVQALAEYAKGPEGSATLFLLAEGYKAPPALDKAVPKQRKKIFFELFENRKREWLSGYFRKSGVDIDEEAIEVLLELVENNTQEMKIAADKLILIIGKNEHITADDVEEFIYHSKEENVFTLFDRLVKRDFPGSLEIMRKILLAGGSSGVQVLGGLLWQFRRLLHLSALFDKNYSSEEAFRETAIRGKKNQQNYIKGSSNYSTEELKRAVALIAEYDALVREHPGDVSPLLLDLFLFRITRRLV